MKKTMINNTNNESLAFKTKQIIKKYNFIFKKNFGQNFLVDENVLNKIINAAEIKNTDIIIEIGPGIGTLTRCLAKKAKKVIAIEIDKNLIPVLNETLIDFKNIDIINNDVLKVDIKNIVEKNKNNDVKIVANLPYYITTPIIMNILENNISVKSITVMIQKEVAYRMQANVGTKDYGALSLIVQYFAKPYLVANVPQNCFMPRPNVDSAVINLEILKEPPVNVNDLSLMFKIIKIAFSQRRKTLLNCIFNSKNFNFDKETILQILNLACIDEQIRGEKLTLQDFANLTNIILNFIKT